MLCPKCGLYELQPDENPSAPSDAMSCICGYVGYYHDLADDIKITGARGRTDVKAAIKKMLDKGFTRDHILASFDLQDSTLLVYISEIKKERGTCKD